MKKIFVRIAVEDFVVPIERLKDIATWAVIYDTDGVECAEPKTFIVGYEDAEGVKCDDKGNYIIT
jgi:hypothetical protein